jgi:ATP-dependent RNA helicase RhlE
MDKEINKTEFPEEVTISKVKIASEQDEVKMKF